MDVSLLYCSVGCSRTPHAVSWNKSGILAFAADKSIALAESKNDILQVTAMLHGHSEKVNCVHWITCRSHDQFGRVERQSELLSGSVDKSVQVWQCRDNQQFSCVAVLSGHSQPVSCITGMYHPMSHDTLVISGSSDSTVIVWSRGKDKDEFQQKQSLSFGRGFTMAIDCYHIIQSNTSLIFCGGDDSKLHIYRESTDQMYESVLSVSGHEDWIRGIHVCQQDNGDLLVASCSQDMYIRIWRLFETTPTTWDSGDLKLKGNIFQTSGDGLEYSVTLEAVLLGHDDWVYGVQWHPLIKREDLATPTQPMCLLSVSMDKTMILWCPDQGTGMWLEQVRVGDVGGNSLGLYGGVFGPAGDIILAHGYQGAFHIWKRRDDGSLLWKPVVAPSGHFGPVHDMSWEPVEGRYLVSVSGDQTSRLHAPWNTPARTSWHELARPQVHGYDMQCIAMVTSSQFVSGADEKVLRVFEASQNFIGNLSRIAGYDIKEGYKLPLGASVPSLGLSNKAVFTDEASSNPDESITKNPFADHIPSFASVELEVPPVEEHLIQNTLWPETQKLYGHSYELYCVASSPDGKLVASACKANKAEYAAIRVWNTASWSQVALLIHHTLTVTQLAFSHDSSKLLAVSRDRCWSLWNRNGDSVEKNQDIDLFSMVASMDKSTKAHSRIIWSCSWSPDDLFFVTASRDKRVCMWSVEGVSGGWGLVSPPLELSLPVTAVDFAPIILTDKRYLLAMGLESGEICFVEFFAPDKAWSPLIKIHPFLGHSSTVCRLQWKPHPLASSRKLVLASCSVDHSVRLLAVDATKLAQPDTMSIS